MSGIEALIGLTRDELKAEHEAAVSTLGKLESDLWHEYIDGGLTTAQKIGALSEIRKTVYLRGLITGIVPTPEVDSSRDG